MYTDIVNILNFSHDIKLFQINCSHKYVLSLSYVLHYSYYNNILTVNEHILFFIIHV